MTHVPVVHGSSPLRRDRDRVLPPAEIDADTILEAGNAAEEPGLELASGPIDLVRAVREEHHEDASKGRIE